jgi:hypothetical protein
MAALDLGLAQISSCYGGAHRQRQGCRQNFPTASMTYQPASQPVQTLLLTMRTGSARGRKCPYSQQETHDELRAFPPFLQTTNRLRVALAHKMPGAAVWARARAGAVVAQRARTPGQAVST